MASNAEVKAASYFGPMAVATPSDGTPGNNVIRRASSSTNTSEALDTATLTDGRVVATWAGKYVDVKNESTSDYLEFAFSVSAQTLVYNTSSAFTAGSAAAGWRLSPGETKSVLVPPTALYVNWVLSAAGPSTVAFYCSEGNVGTK